MLTRIFIDNYKCFSNFELEPARINLLLGLNGGGKSSFFDALTGIVDLTRQGAEVHDVFSAASLTRWDTRDRQRLELDVRLDSDEEEEAKPYHYTVVFRHDRANDRSVIDAERVTHGSRTLFSFEDENVHLFNSNGVEGTSFPFRGNRSFLAQIEERAETRDLIRFLAFLEGVWTVRLDARAMRSTTKREETTLARDGANFPSWYRHLQQEAPERLLTLATELAPVLPGLTTLKLPTDGDRTRYLVAVLSASEKAYEVSFRELSDGQRTLIVLYTLLRGAPPAGHCLLLDEPELHVGLAEVQPWLGELVDLYGDQGQVFVASQNPEVIDYMAAGDSFFLERPDGGPARARRAPFDREAEISASEQVARGLDLGE